MNNDLARENFNLLMRTFNDKDAASIIKGASIVSNDYTKLVYPDNYAGAYYDREKTS